MVRPLPEICANDQARFWAKVDTRVLTGCWPWTGGISRNGYGDFGCDGGRNYGAHRMALYLTIGRPVPEALSALHSCDNRKCCNPLHLRWGTTQDNHDDMILRNRKPRGATHHSVLKPGRMPKGEKHHSAKFTEFDIRLIRSAVGFHKDIAALFGTSRVYVSAIRRKLAWAHLD